MAVKSDLKPTSIHYKSDSFGFDENNPNERNIQNMNFNSGHFPDEEKIVLNHHEERMHRMKEQEKAMVTTENSSLDGKSFASKTKAMT